MGPQIEETELEEGAPVARAENFWEGLVVTVIVVTVCLLVLHWGGVIH